MKAEEQRRNRSESEMDSLRSALSRAQEIETDLRVQLESTQTLLSEHTTDAQAARDLLLSIQQQLRTCDQEKRLVEERLRDAR